MYIKADLQAHYPPEEFFKYDEIIYQARRKLGENGLVAITDFHPNLRYQPLLNFAKKENKQIIEIGNIGFYDLPHKILVLRSQEIPTKTGHVLGLGIPFNVSINHHKKLGETIDEIKSYNAISIIDHPFYFEGAGMYLKKNLHLLKQVDALEGHNSETFILNNPLTQRFYKTVKPQFPNLGIVASSDSHTIPEIGSSHTILNLKEYDLENPQKLLENIKSGIQENKSLQNSLKRLEIKPSLEHAIDVGFNKTGLRRVMKMFANEYYES